MRTRRSGIGGTKGRPGVGTLRPWQEVARLYAERNPADRRPPRRSRCEQLCAAAERKLRAALVEMGIEV